MESVPGNVMTFPVAVCHVLESLAPHECSGLKTL